jgi:hypothetical protein
MTYVNKFVNFSSFCLNWSRICPLRTANSLVGEDMRCHDMCTLAAMVGSATRANGDGRWMNGEGASDAGDCHVGELHRERGCVAWPMMGEGHVAVARLVRTRKGGEQTSSHAERLRWLPCR